MSNSLDNEPDVDPVTLEFYSTLRTANLARQIEWDSGGSITINYAINELMGEVGEACNVIKKIERERLGLKGSRDTTEHLLEELSDVIICLDLLAIRIPSMPDIGFDNVTWPALYPYCLEGKGNPLLLSNWLTMELGRLTKTILNHQTEDLTYLPHGIIETHLRNCTSLVRLIAESYWLAIGPAVEHKFNGTSLKMGLNTRLQRS